MTQDEALSALLDGALAPEEAARLRAAIAADPALRADHAALAHVDEALRTMADEMAFLPQAPAPLSPVLSAGGVAVGLAGLLAVRLLPKLLDLPLAGLAVQALAAGAILIAILTLTREHGGTGKEART